MTRAARAPSGEEKVPGDLFPTLPPNKDEEPTSRPEDIRFPPARDERGRSRHRMWGSSEVSHVHKGPDLFLEARGIGSC